MLYLNGEANGDESLNVALNLTKKGIDLQTVIESGGDYSHFENDFSTEAIYLFRKKLSDEAKKATESPPVNPNDEEVEKLLARMREHRRNWNETPGYADLWKAVMAEAWEKFGYLNDPKNYPDTPQNPPNV
jgi:hypothetical protein